MGLKDFGSKLDDLFEKYPGIEKTLFEDFPQKTEKVSLNELSKKMKKLTIPKTTSFFGANKLMETEFDETIGKPFLKFIGKEDIEGQFARVSNFFDGIKAMGNPRKKALTFRYLIKSIYKQYKENKEGTLPTIKIILNYLIAELRGSYKYDRVEGMRRFLVKTLDLTNPQSRYVPNNEDQLFFHSTDVIFFVELALEDHANYVMKNPIPYSLEYISSLKERQDDGRNTIKNDFYNTKLVELNVRNARKKLRKDLLVNPIMIEKLPALDFFVHFFDFFDYYEKLTKTPTPVYIDYHRIFFSFYEFINQVRSEILDDIENPYQFLLEQMEICLVETMNTEEWVGDISRNRICRFSHRKYSEMYFFYKIYLIATNKPFTSGLQDFSGYHFNTHTRIFMLFASENLLFGSTLTNACQNLSDAKKESICISWKVYNILLTYVHTPEQTAEFLTFK